jgi:uncharacterized RDD family membrane protein YckC
MATGYGTEATVGARAGFWVRFFAAFIDGLLVGVIDTILAIILHTGGDGLALVVSIAYFVYFEGGPRGAGPGKRAMNIRVCDIHTGAPIGYPRAFIRWIGAILSAIPIFLGYFWMLWDGQRQCWHDKLAQDIVVPAVI